MKQRFGVFATLVFAGTFVSPKSVQGQSEAISASGPTITVQVYKWASISPATLEKGQAVAGEIFKEAGVELRWTECPCEGRPKEFRDDAN